MLQYNFENVKIDPMEAAVMQNSFVYVLKTIKMHKFDVTPSFPVA
jgi:hypothetical protein